MINYSKQFELEQQALRERHNNLRKKIEEFGISEETLKELMKLDEDISDLNRRVAIETKRIAKEIKRLQEIETY